jgi:Zn-dependent protease/CBS domain-containing protein
MIGWSWKLGRVAGIDVYMHGTFLILLAWVGMSHYLQRHRLADAGAGIVFILALFAIIVLHELGHALTARRFGIRTRDITLLPIGGVARLERMPDDPKQELLVALAGPAVNVVLAALLFGVVTPTAWHEVRWVGGDFLWKLMWVNVTLAVFNLIPAFPMDGGRALRAVLAMRMDYVRATQIAAHIGQGVALVFGLIGLFSNPFLVFVALFVWMGAAAEASMTQMKSALGGLPVSRVMITHFETLTATDTLQRAFAHVLAGFQHDFPVVEAGRVVGVLTRANLMKGLTQKGAAAPVAAAMTSHFDSVEPAEMLEGAVQRLQASGCPALPVVRDGVLVGMLTMENVGEFLMIQSALRGGEAPRRVPTAATTGTRSVSAPPPR